MVEAIETLLDKIVKNTRNTEKEARGTTHTLMNSISKTNTILHEMIEISFDATIGLLGQIADQLKSLLAFFGAKKVPAKDELTSALVQHEKMVVGGRATPPGTTTAVDGAASGPKAMIASILLDIAKSLGPVAGFLKMITAILQITLYPFIQFVFQMLKPVMNLFIKFLMLWYQYGTPALKALGGLLGILSPVGMLGALLKDVNIKSFMDAMAWVDDKLKVLGNFIKEMFGSYYTFISTVLTAIGNVVIAEFQLIANTISNVLTFVASVFIGIAKIIVNNIGFIFNTITNLMAVILGTIGLAVEQAMKGHFVDAAYTLAGMGSKVVEWAKNTKGEFVNLAKDNLGEVGKMADNFLKIFEGIGKDSINLAKVASTEFGNIGSAFGSMVSSMAASVQSAISGSSKVSLGSMGYNSSTIQAAIDKYGSVRYLSSTGKASGGPVSGGTSYMVGEKGPELFTPGSSGNITPNNKLGGGGVTIIVQGNVDSQGTIDKIVAAVNKAQWNNSKRVGSW